MYSKNEKTAKAVMPNATGGIGRWRVVSSSIVMG
jgi:hypothetical protein